MKLLIKTLSLITSLVFISACTKAQPNDPPETMVSADTEVEPIIIGNKLRIYSEVLGEEKELYISLPPMYNQHVQSYPVVFALEAEYLFEATSTVARYMSSRSKMPESIIVGIANGEFDKRHEVGYKRWGGKPEAYIRFFKQELIPYLEENYRVNSHRTVIGLSPSTGFLFEVFSSHPGLFKAYLALSAHLEWDRIVGSDLFDEVISKNNDPNYPKSVFYFARAASDFPTFVNSEEKFNDALSRLENYTADRVKIKVDIMDEEEHYLMALAGLRSGFEAIYPNNIWRNPGWAGWDKEADYAQKYFINYYDELSSLYGFDIYPVENAHGYGFSLTGKVHSAKRFGTNQQVMELAKLGIDYYPNSAQLHMDLAEAYKKNGDITLALEAGEKAVELAYMYKSKNLQVFRQRLTELKGR
ncbi:esterase family protein [Fulvivirga ulvae]|uniref:alpha/beta hydrolase-fold protein n=1 Tax=Fulvivirga ulvae TaxID=2904245 RepID=UPI001F290249|nr:alpha/beta hydrolase-fold protein [Fulvivirga ulvae]UII31068.1 esterase family protein [Fulvivirga ulvae]